MELPNTHEESPKRFRQSEDGLITPHDLAVARPTPTPKPKRLFATSPRNHTGKHSTPRDHENAPQFRQKRYGSSDHKTPATTIPSGKMSTGARLLMPRLENWKEMDELSPDSRQLFEDLEEAQSGLKRIDRANGCSSSSSLAFVSRFDQFKTNSPFAELDNPGADKGDTPDLVVKRTLRYSQSRRSLAPFDELKDGEESDQLSDHADDAAWGDSNAVGKRRFHGRMLRLEEDTPMDRLYNSRTALQFSAATGAAPESRESPVWTTDRRTGNPRQFQDASATSAVLSGQQRRIRFDVEDSARQGQARDHLFQETPDCPRFRTRQLQGKRLFSTAEKGQGGEPSSARAEENTHQSPPGENEQARDDVVSRSHLQHTPHGEPPMEPKSFDSFESPASLGDNTQEATTHTSQQYITPGQALGSNNTSPPSPPPAARTPQPPSGMLPNEQDGGHTNSAVRRVCGSASSQLLMSPLRTVSQRRPTRRQVFDSGNSTGRGNFEGDSVFGSVRRSAKFWDEEEHGVERRLEGRETSMFHGSDDRGDQACDQQTETKDVEAAEEEDSPVADEAGHQVETGHGEDGTTHGEAETASPHRQAEIHEEHQSPEPESHRPDSPEPSEPGDLLDESERLARQLMMEEEEALLQRIQEEQLRIIEQMRQSASGGSEQGSGANGASTNEENDDLAMAMRLAAEEQADYGAQTEDEGGAAFDPDEMSYDELLELGERIGDVGKERWKSQGQHIVANLMVVPFKLDKAEFHAEMLKHTEILQSAKAMTGKDMTPDYVFDDPKCVICQYPYEDGELLKVLPCSHGFHEECVDGWLLENKTCVTCKQSIDPKDRE